MKKKGNILEQDGKYTKMILSHLHIHKKTQPENIVEHRIAYKNIQIIKSVC